MFAADNLEHIFRSAVMPTQFRFEAYSALPTQVAFREAVLKLVKKSGHACYTEIAYWSGEKRILPIRSTVDAEDRHLIKSAISSLRFDRDAGISPKHANPLPTLSKDDFWPSCIGVPYAKDTAKPECSSCVFNQECQIIGRHALAKTNLPMTLSVEDAEKIRNQMMVRERVQRHRDKKKLPPHKMQAAIDYLKQHRKRNRKRDFLPEEG